MEKNIGAQGQPRRSGVVVAVTAFPMVIDVGFFVPLCAYFVVYLLCIGCWVQQWGMILMLFGCGIMN